MEVELGIMFSLPAVLMSRQSWEPVTQRWSFSALSWRKFLWDQALCWSLSLSPQCIHQTMNSALPRAHRSTSHQHLCSLFPEARASPAHARSCNKHLTLLLRLPLPPTPTPGTISAPSFFLPSPPLFCWTCLHSCFSSGDYIPCPQAGTKI